MRNKGKAVKKKSKASKPKLEPKVSDWDKLRELIAEYAEAYVADSWKGGGDPESYAEIELRLQLQTVMLNTHIDRLEREHS